MVSTIKTDWDIASVEVGFGSGKVEYGIAVPKEGGLRFEGALTRFLGIKVALTMPGFNPLGVRSIALTPSDAKRIHADGTIIHSDIVVTWSNGRIGTGIDIDRPTGMMQLRAIGH